MRTKSNKYVQLNDVNYQQLKSFYLRQVKFTKQLDMTKVNLAFYWSKATKDKHLLSLILLIAIAYTCAVRKGLNVSFKGVAKYICRLSHNTRKYKRHSNFWLGLYGDLWVHNFQICHSWVEHLMILTPNKLPFYQQGMRAKALIISTL